MKKYYLQNTYMKFDAALNDFVESPLLFDAEEMRGETAPQAHDVYVAGTGNVPAPIGDRVGRVETCDICDQEYRVIDLVEFRGKFYCKELLHYKVIGDILLQENAGKYRPLSEVIIGYKEPVIDQGIK